MLVLAGELTVALTYPSSHTFWKVLGAAGIAGIVIVVLVLMLAIWLLSGKGPGSGPMG